MKTVSRASLVLLTLCALTLTAGTMIQMGSANAATTVYKPYTALGAEPFVKGGAPTAASFVKDITSARAAIALDEEGLKAYVAVIRKQATESGDRGFSACTMKFGEDLSYMSAGLTTVIVAHDVVFEDPNYKNGAPAWCETVTVALKDPARQLVIRIIVPRRCGNIGVINVVTHLIPTTSDKPSYACNSLVVTATAGTSASAVVGFTVKDVTDTRVDIQWAASGSADVITAARISGDSASAVHTYTQSGTYQVSARLIVDANGKTATSSGSHCTTTVTIPTTTVGDTAAYSCNSVSISQSGGAAVLATVGFTAENVTDAAVSVQWAASGPDDVTTAASITGPSAARASYTYASAGTYVVTATLTVDDRGTTETASGSRCTTTVTVPSTVVGDGAEYSCNGMSFSSTGGNEITATVDYTADNVTDAAVSVQWAASGPADVTTAATDTSSSTARASYTYASAGTYVVTATLSVDDGGTTELVSGANCTTSLAVPLNTPGAAYSCNGLWITPTSGTGVRATVRFTADNVTDAAVSIQWAASGPNDVTTAATVTSPSSARASYTYASAGTYEVTATLTVDDNGTTETASGAKCTTTVVVREPSACSHSTRDCTCSSTDRGTTRCDCAKDRHGELTGTQWSSERKCSGSRSTDGKCVRSTSHGTDGQRQHRGSGKKCGK